MMSAPAVWPERPPARACPSTGSACSQQRGDDLLHGGVAGYGGHLGDLLGQVGYLEMSSV